MASKRITVSILAIVIFLIIAGILIVTYQKDIDTYIPGEPVSQTAAEQAALTANEDWVLELNALGRAELYDSVLEGDTWVVRIRNYQRPEDQTGYLLVYKVDQATGAVENKTIREEVP